MGVYLPGEDALSGQGNHCSRKTALSPLRGGAVFAREISVCRGAGRGREGGALFGSRAISGTRWEKAGEGPAWGREPRCRRFAGQGGISYFPAGRCCVEVPNVLYRALERRWVSGSSKIAYRAVCIVGQYAGGLQDREEQALPGGRNVVQGVLV